ncbi:hypothetical protein Vadar_025612 [Vaccinium darrowii]|uniref:Uncharacterized protein n=1 Tax=Vaccinium darrowii TaxID=229202 RepID=A0ACB7ZEQ7_9ERIC|nr:hypothetical protein Vadar_025612 [Vaccinium darrowii]
MTPAELEGPAPPLTQTSSERHNASFQLPYQRVWTNTNANSLLWNPSVPINLIITGHHNTNPTACSLPNSRFEEDQLCIRVNTHTIYDHFHSPAIKLLLQTNLIPAIRKSSSFVAVELTLHPMITSRAISLNQRLSTLLLHHYNPCTELIPSLSYHTSHSTRPNTRPKPTKKPLPQPIPFITDLKEIQNPDEALSLFNEYTQMGFKHDYPSYSSLIYKLARCRNFEAVKTLLLKIKQYNIRCEEALFIGLIRHYGKSQLPNEAIDLFQEMTSFNCVRTLQSFNTLLNVLVDNGMLGNADELFKCSSKMGFRPNSISYNIMIKGWLERGEWEQACRVFDEMLERGVEPTVVTHNCLIGYLCKKGDLDGAKGVLDDMTKKGKKPNAVTYALLMAGLCSLDKYKEAKKMMFDMEYRGCKPQMKNYGVLMNDLAKRGLIEEAKAFLLEMKKRRIKPDVVTYNILINYLCKEGRAAEAYKTLVEMQVQGCEPNAATYRMIVDGFCRVEEFEGGLKVLNAMLLSKHCPRPETFCCLIRGLAKYGKVDDVCFVLEEMEKKKMKFELESWEVLVRDAFGEGRCGVSSLVTELISAH